MKTTVKGLNLKTFFSSWNAKYIPGTDNNVNQLIKQRKL